MDGFIMQKPYSKMDDLGGKPLFSETSTWMSGCRHSHMELVLDEVVVATGPCLSNGPTGWLSKIKISQFAKVWGILWDLEGLRGERGSKDFAERKM